ncbi:RAMP superfamily CRISPR-associated protein [Streptomyces sp. NPDC002742]|uniref:RAMP superfamily CRISPR-associated protein n=1 Tax=Streptomyces sp. NPDC002742 TaxID=3364663 RepID=UPI0036AD98A5
MTSAAPERRGRAVARRLRVRGWLRTLSPLHTGAAGQGPAGLLTVAVDGLGRPYVPGTGLAGALRAVAARLPGVDEEHLRDLWGWMEPKGQEGSVSRLLVRDALLAEGTGLDEDGIPDRTLEATRLDSRLSVGIDRVTGAAAHGFLHGRVVVPRGTYLRLEMDLESAADAAAGGQAAADAEHLRLLLRALRHGQVRLGAAKTRGLGRVELLTGQTVVDEHDLTTPAGLVAALGHGGPVTGWDLAGEDGALSGGPPLEQFTVRVDWHPTAPLMVRSAVDGVLADAIPYTSATRPGKVALCLPGSALKGRLRAQAERIERTVRQVDVPSSADGDPVERSAAFRRQLDELAAVRALFGAAPAARNAQHADRRGAGALTVDDCFSDAALPETLWQVLFGGPGGEQEADADTALESLSDHGFARADHVAIDRWTGGAAEGRLFSVLEPHGITWEPLTLTIDQARLDAHGETGAAATALLLLVLRDLTAGRIPLGWGTNRGMGNITVDAVTLTLPGHDDPVALQEYLAGPEAADLTEQWCRYLDGSPA